MTQLNVFLDGVLAGELEQLPGGALIFTYDTGYISGRSATPLSLSMPLSATRHGNRVVSAWLEGLLPDGLQIFLTDNNGEAIFAIIALGLCQAAYFSEDLRSGLRAVPAGQMEAARALGHGFVGTMRHVLMPQAVRNALPALINHSVSLFKNSSLAMAIGVAELTHAVKEVENQSFQTFETYLIATIAYLVCSLAIMAAGAVLNRRVSISGAGRFPRCFAL